MKPELQSKLAGILENKSLGKEQAIDFSHADLPYKIGQMFPSYARYALEIGSGWGEFTLATAKAESTTLVIALEKKKKRVSRCIRDQEQAGVENIRWMIVDVDWFFEELFEPATFDHVTINFPDPWPKARHHKHRFMRPELVEILTALTKQRASLEFATDFWPYMEIALHALENSSQWQNDNGPGVLLKEIPGRPKSHFEELKRSEGENVYFAQFSKG